MILVRDVFQLKYGQARPALAMMKEGRELAQKAGMPADWRILTDITGPAYTLVLENKHESLSAYDGHMKGVTGNDAWHAWHQKFVALVDHGHREIYTIVEG
jgi:hypothetical protein